MTEFIIIHFQEQVSHDDLLGKVKPCLAKKMFVSMPNPTSFQCFYFITPSNQVYKDTKNVSVFFFDFGVHQTRARTAPKNQEAIADFWL